MNDEQVKLDGISALEVRVFYWMHQGLKNQRQRGATTR